MPEEINRIVVDHLSELLFLHSAEATENLAAEGSPRRAGALRRQHDDRHARRARGRDPRARRGRRRSGSSPGHTSSSPFTARRSSTVRSWREAMSALGRGRAASCRSLFPVHPRTRARLEELGLDAQRGRHARRARRLPRLPLARGRRRGGPHRLGRDPGGDDVARRPLLHPARQHRAPGDRPGGHEHAARPRSRADRGDPGAPRSGERHPRNVRIYGMARRPSASLRSSPIGSFRGDGASFADSQGQRLLRPLQPVGAERAALGADAAGDARGLAGLRGARPRDPARRAGGRQDHPRADPAPQLDLRHADRLRGHLRPRLGARRHRRLHRGNVGLHGPLQDRGADGAGGRDGGRPGQGVRAARRSRSSTCAASRISTPT